MQKKIIALAIAGLSTAAFAQTNVTISGNAEAHFESVAAKGATAANSDATSRSRVTDNTSALKFAVTEQLGGGTSAFFQCESDMGMDNNASGTSGATGFCNRNTAVGLGTSFGTVLMGHWDAYYQSHMEGGVDWGSSAAMPHNANTLNVIGQVGGVGVIGGRLNNVIAYITPEMSGLSARFAYAAGGTDSVENTSNGIAKNNGWNLFVKYGNGPVNAFWSHLKVSNSGAAAASVSVATPAAGTAAGTAIVSAATAVTSGNDVKADRLGAAYTMGAIKFGLVYDKTRVNTVATGAVAAKRTAWSLPVSYTMGNNTFNFAYAKGGKVTGAAGEIADSGVKNIMVGYNYAMSKRTSVGVSYSKITNESAASYDFWSRGVGNVKAGADPSSLSLGMNHTF